MSGYRIFRICTTGPYVDLFFRFLDSHAELGFEGTLERCRQNGFLYPGSLKKHLEALGAEVHETIVDAPVLQKKWLAEHGFDPSQGFEKEAVFWAQLKAIKPDIVYFQTFFALAPEVRRRIKQECPSVRLVVGHRGFPIGDCTGYEDVDAVFLGYPRFHEPWHAAGVKTFFHLHCFDDALLPAIDARAAEIDPIDFSFIGTTGWGFGPHDGRYYDLRRVMDAVDLTVFGNEPLSQRSVVDALSPSERSRLRHRAIETMKYVPHIGLKVIYKVGQLSNVPVLMRAVEATVRRKKYGLEPKPPVIKQEDFWYHHERPIGELYPDRMYPARFGIEYFALLAASKVTWNRHLEMAGAGANMRLFEACGVGVCQLVDVRDEVLEAYEADTEIATYRSIDECIEKARWLLDHPAERQAIARAGQRRTLRDHTVAQRTEHLHQLLQGLLHMQPATV